MRNTAALADLRAEHLRRCAEHHRNAPDPIMDAIMVDLAFDLFLTRIPAMSDTPKEGCTCERCEVAKQEWAEEAERAERYTATGALNGQRKAPDPHPVLCSCRECVARFEAYKSTATVAADQQTRDARLAEAARKLVPGDEGYFTPPPEADHFVLLQAEKHARAWSCGSREEAERMANALSVETGLWWRVVSTD